MDIAESTGFSIIIAKLVSGTNAHTLKRLCLARLQLSISGNDLAHRAIFKLAVYEAGIKIVIHSVVRYHALDH